MISRRSSLRHVLLCAAALLLAGCRGDDDTGPRNAVAVNDPLHIAVVLKTFDPIPFSGIQQALIGSKYVNKQGEVERAIVHVAVSLQLCPCDRVQSEKLFYLDVNDTDKTFVEQGFRLVWRDSRFARVSKNTDGGCVLQPVESALECPDAPTRQHP